MGPSNEIDNFEENKTAAFLMKWAKKTMKTDGTEDNNHIYKIWSKPTTTTKTF